MHVYKGVHTIQEGCLLRGASRENSRKPPFAGDSVRQLLPDPAKEGKLPHLSERLQEGARHRSTHYFTFFSQPRYKKVLYRKAKALAGLNDLPGALACCALILEDEPDNVYTLKLKTECESRLHKEQKRNEEIARSVLRCLECLTRRNSAKKRSSSWFARRWMLVGTRLASSRGC